MVRSCAVARSVVDLAASLWISANPLVAFEDATPRTVALINSIAAGAILAMIADTMIPEAYRDSAHKYQLWTGFITVVGFITAFAISSSGA